MGGEKLMLPNPASLVLELHASRVMLFLGKPSRCSPCVAVACGEPGKPMGWKHLGGDRDLVIDTLSNLGLGWIYRASRCFLRVVQRFQIVLLLVQPWFSLAWKTHFKCTFAKKMELPVCNGWVPEGRPLPSTAWTLMRRAIGGGGWAGGLHDSAWRSHKTIFLASLKSHYRARQVFERTGVRRVIQGSEWLSHRTIDLVIVVDAGRDCAHAEKGVTGQIYTYTRSMFVREAPTDQQPSGHHMNDALSTHRR